MSDPLVAGVATEPHLFSRLAVDYLIARLLGEGGSTEVMLNGPDDVYVERKGRISGGWKEGSPSA
jgi:hypothetical protein